MSSSSSSIANWSAIGVSGSFENESRFGNMVSSAGGVSGMVLLSVVAVIVASNGSSAKEKLSFLGTPRLDEGDDIDRCDRCDERRDSGFSK